MKSNNNNEMNINLEKQKVLLRENEKFVADWYENNKDYFNTQLFNLINKNTNSQMFNWLKTTHNSINKLFQLHQYGYKIQTTNKLYLVELPNPESTSDYKFYLAKTIDGRIVIQSSKMLEIKDNWKLTKDEILQHFEWAFPFAKEIK